MQRTHNAAPNLPLFATAILLSSIKAVYIVASAAVVIAVVSPAPAQWMTQPPRQQDPTQARPPIIAFNPTKPMVLRRQDAELPGLFSDLPSEPPPAAVVLATHDPSTIFEPAGCSTPIDDYSSVQVGERVLSVRTFRMLQQAMQIYGGPIDLTGTAIVSIDHPGKLQANPDSHHDRGVLDISVQDPESHRMLYDEIEQLIKALRAAGMAAWLRDADDLYPGSVIHIHAVAIGDRQLSQQALDQLVGKYGYFFGRKGYFDDAGALDPHGTPVICRWMREAGFADMREDLSVQYGNLYDWQERLRAAAESFITSSSAETLQVARVLDFTRSGNEDPSNMCGPLSAAILQRAGLLPSSIGPVTDLANYWLADPTTNGRPWSLFPSDEYLVQRFNQSIESFDFSEWPLYPGDFVYTYSGNGPFSHMFVVTEVDGFGRVFTVTNQDQPNGDYLIQRVLLYDPLDPAAGVLRSTCQSCGTWRRRTGLGGFDVLRRLSLADPTSSELSYKVQPGDTLPEIASRHRTSVADILAMNPLSNPKILPVGVFLKLPISSSQDLVSTTRSVWWLDLSSAELLAIGNETVYNSRPFFGDDQMVSPLD